MFRIERIITFKKVDNDGELVPDVESDFFVKFAKDGNPVFDYDFRAKEYATRDEAEAVVDQLKPRYDNNKNRFIRYHFKIQEVKAA